jgi:large subunit ribosomal protein L25
MSQIKHFELEATLRTDIGKGASRRLRHAGLVPVVIYGGAGKEPMSLTISHNELLKHLAHEAFYSHVLVIRIEGHGVESAVLKDVQRHPSRPVILHIDLQRVSDTQKLHMHVPLHFVNGDVAPGVKQGGGSISHQLVEVEVSCLPKDLPEFIEVDLGGMQVDDVLHLSDLKCPAGVELLALSHGEEHDLPVASLHLARGAKEATAEDAGE